MTKKSIFGLGILTMLMASSLHAIQLVKADSPITITLERSVHFFSADGSDVVVNPGTYFLEPAEEWLRLIPGERRDAFLLESERTEHQEDISEPVGLSVPSEQDEHVIAFLLPGGTSLEAVGSYSGIRSRALTKAQLLQRRARIRLARGTPGTTKRKPAPTGERPAYYDGPRIRSVQLPSGTVMGQNILLRVNLDQLVPNERVDYVEDVLIPKDPTTFLYPPCFFRIEPGLGRAAQQATASGELTLSVSGWFHWRSYQGSGEMSLDRGFKSPDSSYPDPPKCGLRLKLKTWTDPRHPSYKEVTYSNLQMSPYTSYSVKNTWALKDKFDFKLTSSIFNTGSCIGTSIGIPTNYAVGVKKYENDISILIRSGPIGTNCLFASKLWYLPDGMFVSSMQSEYQYEGKPKAENACKKNYTGFKDFNRSADIPLVHTSYEAIPHDLRTTFTPWGINLVCGLTITNDHGVRFVIKEIVFKGPAGLNFP